MKLEEIEQIKQLKARYFRYLDTRQWDKWATVFTADAVLEHPVARPDPVIGRDAIIRLVSAEDRVTVHHGHMPEIEIIDELTARGVWAMTDLILWPPQAGRGRVEYRGAGHYIERYRKEDGAWRIAHIHLRRLHLEVVERFRDDDLSAFTD
jgi:SnoaL-like domain